MSSKGTLTSDERATNLFKDSFKFQEWINWLLGVGIFEFPSNKPRILLSITYKILLYSFISYGIITSFEVMLKTEWRVFEVVALFMAIGVNYVVAFFTMTFSTFKRSKALILWRRVIETDATLDKLGAKRDYKKDSHDAKYVFILWLIIISSMFIMDTVNFLRYYGIWQGFLAATCYHLPVFTNSVADISFGIALLTIGRRFEKLNNLMLQRFKKINTLQLFTIKTNRFDSKSPVVVTISEPTKNSLKHLVQTSMHIHLELCKITRRVNDAFCMLIILELIISFNQIIASAYTVYFYLRGSLHETSNNEIEDNSEDLIVMVVWGLVFAFRVVSINHLCGWIAKQAQKTNTIIREIDDIYNTGDVKEDLHQFSLQMVLKPLYLTATGFFNIDDNCTRGFFGSVATYVVIFIQMSSTTKALKVLGDEKPD
ncbi:putative gustatory receptor 28b [Prorops nasuta]|uniref:putative gustatory receptor 28b n=1 Tax=Prorops nasuta TaxID=863751 RepID=UPI0034CF893C